MTGSISPKYHSPVTPIPGSQFTEASTVTAETLFKNSVADLQTFLDNNPLTFSSLAPDLGDETDGEDDVYEPEIHQTLVAVLEPADFEADPTTAVSLVVKPGPGRSQVGMLAHQVLDIASLGHTVPRAASVTASEIPATDNKSYEVFTAVDNKQYAIAHSDTQEPISLKNGQKLLVGGHLYLLIKEQDGSYRVDRLQFHEKDGKLYPTGLDANEPKELILSIKKNKALLVLEGDKFHVVKDPKGEWVVETEAEEIDTFLDNDPIIWKIDDESFAPRALCERVIDNCIERDGIAYPIEDDELQPAKNVDCLVQEKVAAAHNVEVKPGDKTFQKNVHWDSLIDSVLSMILICPQDSKCSDGDTNFLALPDTGQGYGIVFIDTDEAFPSNNSYSEAMEEHKGHNIAVLRPGLLAFDKTAATLDKGHLKHAQKQIQHIVENKEKILHAMQGKVADDKIAALSERIDRLSAFTDKTFSLEELVFAVFPTVKNDWQDFAKQDRDRATCAEWVGHTTLKQWQKAMQRRT